MKHCTKKDIPAIWAEMARRKQQFHADEDWTRIRLWGLFDYRFIEPLLKSGELITDMKPENKTIWVWPSESAYYKHIEPLLSRPMEEIAAMAGW